MFKWVGKVFKYREWADWERTKTFTSYCQFLYRQLFKLENPDGKPTAEFQEVVQRYQLKEDDLQKQVHYLKLYSLAFALIFILIFSYGIYEILQANFFIAMVIFCISLIAISLSFRYHFYLTLIQNRRLNCTLKDWFTLTFKRK